MKRVVVTGAFSYTGAAVARELMARGYGIHTLTNRKAAIAPQLAVGERPEDASSASFRRKPEPSLPNDSLSPLDTGFRWYDADIRASTPITSSSLAFDAAHLEGELAGADVFVNTFWIRLPHGGEDFASAVEKSRLLIESAKRAGVRRIVHVSVSNAAVGSNLGYYAGKAQVEEIVRACGMSYAIVSPTLVVGPNDVLTNNVAWFLRRFPREEFLAALGLAPTDLPAPFDRFVPRCVTRRPEERFADAQEALEALSGGSGR
ncbi:MAG: NmrA family NAD(P)-binding protein, partial [Planctomycetaceae bacterium]|nr:NmrA family NAD(P)-binding protein [Planctomycetaceae bacterium]